MELLRNLNLRAEDVPPKLRRWLSLSRWNRIVGLVSLGWRAAFEYFMQQRRPHRASSVFRLHPRSVIHPLFVRRNSSDLDVFVQIFIDREYRCLDELTDVRLIIDCGANVGYSSAYFLSHHPNSRVVAVEPVPENFAMLRRNLKCYGSRACLIHAAVWSHASRLTLSERRYRDGREWTRQVCLPEPGAKADINGVDIGTLLMSFGEERISILKIDVEGTEAVLFAENYSSWLDKVDAIAIELHDDSAFGDGSEVFFNAIRDRDFRVWRSGQLTVCLRESIQS